MPRSSSILGLPFPGTQVTLQVLVPERCAKIAASFNVLPYLASLLCTHCMHPAEYAHSLQQRHGQKQRGGSIFDSIVVCSVSLIQTSSSRKFYAYSRTTLRTSCDDGPIFSEFVMFCVRRYVVTPVMPRQTRWGRVGTLRRISGWGMPIHAFLRILPRQGRATCRPTGPRSPAVGSTDG